MGARILVIDDDAAVRETLRQVLESAGHAVTCAEDGERGLEAFETARPDLVITDIIMPEREGIATILELRRRRPDRPIVAISGGGRTGGTDFLTMARRLGADAALPKPFELEELLDTVARCLAAGRS
jgi:CheY-like chemotaxis protein